MGLRASLPEHGFQGVDTPSDVLAWTCGLRPECGVPGSFWQVATGVPRNAA